MLIKNENLYLYGTGCQRVKHITDLTYIIQLFFFVEDECANHFTPNQQARMHCYLDLMYQQWQNVKVPAPPPLSPKVRIATINHGFQKRPGLIHL